MKGIESLVKKALKLKSQGLSEAEIAEELNLSLATIDWLLTQKLETKPPVDIKIGWRSIGVFPNRIHYIANIMSDIILEELEKGDEDADSVVGIALNGIPFAVFIAEDLGLELVIYRRSAQENVPGTFSSNSAGVEGKRVIVVDDMLGTGRTMRGVLEFLEEQGANPVLCIVMVNKTEMNEIKGVPLRALIRTRAIA